MRLIAVALATLAIALPGSPAIGPEGCPGDPIVPSRVIEGEFASSVQGAYVMVPFDVPDGTTQVRVKYCWDEPEGPMPVARHTIDLGLWDARPADGTWGTRQFRGWGGSSHPDVAITRQGFSSEAEYLARPRGHVPGRTTRGFVPGPLPAGEWAAELGVAAVIRRDEGDADGHVRWRVEIALSSDPAFAAEPYRPVKYDDRAARRGPGWYAGDFHVHGEHSALGDATNREVVDHAFRPLDQGGAGLDFIALSDYVTTTGWGEIGRVQDLHPDRLVMRSAEVITYRGHTNNHTSAQYVDHRTGPLWLRHEDGTLELLRPARPASAILSAVRAAGGFTQINHPTIFPSSIPAFTRLCRGCPWDHSAAETDYSLVDAIEIQTGPAVIGTAFNPFTRPAIAFWEAALAAGHHVAAVGSSDSHRAGRVDGPTSSPIGQATTVVYARRLSERGIRRAVQAGHTYVKLLGNAGPDLRLEARSLTRPKRRGIMGDTLVGPSAELTAQVLNVDLATGPRTLIVVRDGVPVRTEPVTSSPFTATVRVDVPGRYRLQLERGDVVEALTTPVWITDAR